MILKSIPCYTIHQEKIGNSSPSRTELKVLMLTMDPFSATHYGFASGGSWARVALGNNVLAQPEIEAGRLIVSFDEVLFRKCFMWFVMINGRHGENCDFSRLDVSWPIVNKRSSLMTKYLQDGNRRPYLYFCPWCWCGRIILSWKPWLVK